MEGTLYVMCKKGDTRITWTRGNRSEEDAAREAFNTYLKKKYKAFKVGKRGEQGEEIEAFDPNASEILFVPPIAGG